MSGIFKKSQVDSEKSDTVTVGSGDIKSRPLSKKDILLIMANAPTIEQLEEFAKTVKENNPNSSPEQLADLLNEKVKKNYGPIMDELNKIFNLK